MNFDKNDIEWLIGWLVMIYLHCDSKKKKAPKKKSTKKSKKQGLKYRRRRKPPNLYVLYHKGEIQ